MEEGLPDEDTPESQEGTLLHHFKANPEYERKVLKEKQQDLLKIADDIEAQVFDIVIQNEKIHDYEEFVEQREAEGKWNGLTGHMDLWRRYPRRSLSVIIDWKFGWLSAPAAEFNLQLRGYATLTDDERVYVAIGQPRASYNNRLTIAAYTAQDLVASRLQIEVIRAKSEDPNAPLSAGEAQCRYCKAKIICPAFKAAFEKGLVTLGSLSPEDSKTKRLAIVEARLSQITDEQIGAMIEATKLVEMIYDPLMEEARRRISAGKLDSYKLAKPTERRKIVDSQRAISLMLLAGMSREDVMKCASLSLTKLEDKARDYCNNDRQNALEYVSRHLSSVIETDTLKQRVLKK
jgi:hypothetical protein